MGQAVPGVDPDQIADPEGPAGVEGVPVNGTPAGTFLRSLGPTGREGNSGKPGVGFGAGSTGGVWVQGLEAWEL